MTKRYKMNVTVKIVEIDGSRTYPHELNPDTNLQFETTFNANGFAEMGRILEQLEAIKP